MLRIAIVAGMMLAALSLPVAADTSPDVAAQAQQLANRPVPKSVWRTDDGGEATHLQSQLHCPLAVGSFHRTALITFDTYGFDVECNYLADNHTVLSLYLTRRSDNHPVAADFDGAQREFLSVYGSATPLPDADQGEVPSDATWIKKLYANPANGMHEGIWIADLQGWTLEYRATYASAQAQSVADAIGALTTAARSSAGAHLALCAKSQVPARVAAGTNNTDATALMIMMGALTAGADKAAPDGKDPPVTVAKAVAWCVEDGFNHGEMPVLLWHGVDESGATMSMDRASVMTIQEPPVIESAAEPMLNLLGDNVAKAGKVSFVVSIDNGTVTTFLGIYDDRPDADELAGILDDIMHGRAKALGNVDRKTNTIGISMPNKDQ